jgi:hypothetical protein
MVTQGFHILIVLDTRKKLARCWWLTPVILATQEAEIWRITVRSQPRQIVHLDLISKKKPSQKMGVVEWFKVLALSSNPSTTKKKKKRKKEIGHSTEAK